MQEAIKIIIGIIILILGFPIGNLLAKYTKEEINGGRRWLNTLSLLGLLGALIGLIIGNDAILFTFAFIAIVTSRSLPKKREKEKKNKDRKKRK